MECWSCRGDTPADKPFCANCGASLVARCANCNADLVPSKPFCATCGQPVAAPARTAPASTSRHESGAERRLCSILFVDLVGFTPLAEGLDPEHVRELLSRYFDRAQHIIQVYGGTVEKFIGDAVMAVWGAPLANEDDAERAVRAGLEVVASVEVLGEQSKIPSLRARGGVVTGEVAISVGKVAEGMVLGDTVNAASRVQSVASPGTVLVDEATWRSSSSAIAFEEVGALALKGKSETVNAWRALRVVAQRKGLGRSERLEPPFVGRDEELRLVKDTLHASEREKRARLVSVVGIPGIGKSRLAWEFLKYVDGLASTVYWHEGRSRAYGEGITFGALSEMVRMRAGIVEAEEATSATTKLRECLEEFVADPDERQWIEPRLAYLLGLTDAPNADREELFSAWRRFFERVAEQGPTVMIFEDLQWAEAGLVDFIESILEWSRNYPLFIITLSRPELMDSRPSWGAGLRNFSSLHLEALNEASMRTLLDGFVQGLPASVCEMVLNRAEGVPLYAVETIRMLFDRGNLVDEVDHYRVEGELEALEMPETLHALVASRLDSLPPAQRTLLQNAGVAGSTFTLDTLSAVSDATRADLEVALRDLVRKEYLVTNTDPRSPERGQYGFVQGVIREVAVGTLGRRDRSAKHLALAHHFESMGDDELSSVIATHFLEAFRAAPDDESLGLREQALTWVRRAGLRALQLGSPYQGVALLREALALSSDERVRAELHASIGEGYADLLDATNSIASFKEAIATFDHLNDHEAKALVVAKLIRSNMVTVGLEERFELGVRTFHEVTGGSLLARAHLACAIASDMVHSDQRDVAMDWVERGLELAEQLDDPLLLASALQARSVVLYGLGRHREAVMLIRGVAEIAQEAGDNAELARALTGHSVYVLPDSPRSTMTKALEAIEVARKAGRRSLELTNQLNYIENALYLGLWDEARAMIAEISQRDIGTRHASGLLWLTKVLGALEGDRVATLAFLAEDHELFDDAVAAKTTLLATTAMMSLAVGDLRRAYADAHEAVLLDPFGINSSAVLNIEARAALWLGDLDALREAREAMNRLRGRTIVALRRNADAGIAALEGRPDEAAQIYQEALERWSNLEAPFEIAMCELDMVKVLGPEHPDAIVAKDARDLFTTMGARAFLAMLDDVCGVTPQ